MKTIICTAFVAAALLSFGTAHGDSLVPDYVSSINENAVQSVKAPDSVSSAMAPADSNFDKDKDEREKTPKLSPKVEAQHEKEQAADKAYTDSLIREADDAQKHSEIERAIRALPKKETRAAGNANWNRNFEKVCSYKKHSRQKTCSLRWAKGKYKVVYFSEGDFKNKNVPATPARKVVPEHLRQAAHNHRMRSPSSLDSDIEAAGAAELTEKANAAAAEANASRKE